jgi:hypothetical protein
VAYEEKKLGGNQEGDPGTEVYKCLEDRGGESSLWRRVKYPLIFLTLAIRVVKNTTLIKITFNLLLKL